jgi:predicted secreted protein
MAELALTEADDNGRFTVKVGDVITIHLSENSAAGYRWTVSSLDETRVAVKSQSYEATSAGVGSAGMAVFKLNARQKGSAHVALKKSRSWGQADSNSKTFAVDVDITE